MKNIGVVGCGAIGTHISLAIDQGKITGRLVAVADVDESRAKQLVKRLNNHCRILSALELVDQVDFVVEAASQSVVPSLVERVIQQKKEVLIMSVGGLLQIDSLKEQFQSSYSRLYVPSGAIAGLDAMRAACLEGIQTVILTTRKPPRGLQGALYCVEKGIDLDTLDREMIIFEGSAREAAKAFPKNINVAAALSLAGVGADRTRVRIIADPQATTNSHQIEIVGESGKIVTRTENVPFVVNPKTSYLAALSGIAMLQGIMGSIKIGT